METNPTPSDRLRELLHQSPRAFNRPRSTWTVNIRLRLCALQKSLGSAQGAQAQANIYPWPVNIRAQLCASWRALSLSGGHFCSAAIAFLASV